MAQAIEDPSAPALTPTRSLRSLALRGSAWTVMGFGGSQVLRLAGNLILTRLLFPEAFGIMALVGVFMAGLEMFSDVGIGPSIIQNKRGDDPDFYNTAWTIQILRGFALTACAAVLAYPVAVGWFRKPELVPLILAAGCVPIIMGFNSTKLFTANRHMEFARLTALDLATQAVSLTLTIGLAFWLRSVWSLVIANLAGSVVRCAASHLAWPGSPNRFRFDRDVSRELFRFGRWIFLSTAVNFLASQGDRILLGRYLGDATLGVYNVAFFLSDTAGRLVSTVGHRVMFPTFSRVHNDGSDRLLHAYDKVRKVMNRGVMPAVGLLIGSGPIVVGVLYDKRYDDASWMIQILGIRVAAYCLIVPGAIALMAQGHPKPGSIGQVLKAVCLACGIPLGYRLSGIEGAVWMVGLSEFALTITILWALGRRGLGLPRRDCEALAMVLLGVGIGRLAVRLVGPHPIA